MDKQQNTYTSGDFTVLLKLCWDSGLPISQDIRDMAYNGYFDHADNTASIGVEKFKAYLEQHYPDAYRFVFRTPFEDVPLDVSDDGLKLFVKWRLKIAK